MVTVRTRKTKQQNSNRNPKPDPGQQRFVDSQFDRGFEDGKDYNLDAAFTSRQGSNGHLITEGVFL